jgi:hypothetical protein
MRSELFFIVAGLDNTKEINEDSQGRATREPSRNIGEFYRTVKLSAENLFVFHADSN